MSFGIGDEKPRQDNNSYLMDVSRSLLTTDALPPSFRGKMYILVLKICCPVKHLYIAVTAC